MSPICPTPDDLPSAVFFDLEGTLVAERRAGDGAAREIVMLPGIQKAVDRLPGVPLFIVSHACRMGGRRDSEIAETERLVTAVHKHLGSRITAARFCPHPPTAGCPGHKPAPGLITALAAAHGIDLSRAWSVGHARDDQECARRAGVGQFHWAQTFFAVVASGIGRWALERPPPMPDAQRPAPQLRPATEADLPAIVRIYNDAIEERISTCDLEPVTVAARRPWFDRFDARHPLHVAVAGETVLGWSAILPYDPKPGYAGVVEHSVYVTREARGASLGRQMLEHLLLTAADQGHRCIMGRIFRHNERSLRLHQNLGFQEAGVLRGVALLDGRPADVVIMFREL